MKTLCCAALAAMLLALVCTAGWAESDTVTQTMKLGVNEIAAIRAVNTVGTMVIRRPDVPGTEPLAVGNGDSYLQFTSIVGNVNGGALSRAITAQVTSENLPAGTSLKVTAATATTGSGAGNRGLTTGQQNLHPDATSYPAVAVVDGIQNGYTSTTDNKGCRLSYVFYIARWSDIVATTSNATVEVTYTLQPAD